jgi:hypothetical protein
MLGMLEIESFTSGIKAPRSLTGFTHLCYYLSAPYSASLSLILF